MKIRARNPAYKLILIGSPTKNENAVHFFTQNMQYKTVFVDVIASHALSVDKL
jgi:hypothetical protein